MWHWFRWVLLGIGILIIGFVVLMFPISFYLPHKIPSLILPVASQYDAQASIMPMGEKINHPDAPMGHPGIDFGFEITTTSIPYISSMDGTVSSVKILDNPEKGDGKKQPVTTQIANVYIKNGPYQTAYTEMDAPTLPATIKKGYKIKQGELVGYGNLTAEGDMGQKHEMIHWEFGSLSPILDRFCPLDYFTAESKTRIEKIREVQVWPEMKAQYPLICNGGYDGKYER